MIKCKDKGATDVYRIRPAHLACEVLKNFIKRGNMKRKEKLPELLAPAGRYECLVAAVAAGADAIYIGGKRFGARAYAKNFDTGEISRAVSLCHLHGVKLYVTLNTLICDKEMQDAVEYARELYLLGVDALIVADLGVIREIRSAVPNMELHASTQSSAHNTYGADALSSLGVSRVVLARELSLSDIKSVVAECKAELEVFLHGALCVSHSGQCLFSSLVGGRSGHRGECAQPCRLPYNVVKNSSYAETYLGARAKINATRPSGEYPLSLKDLSLAAHIPELIESGVASLKIEGRMKSPSYVYTVTSVYRKLLDERRAATEKEHEILRRAFSRQGFTDGYFTGKITAKMTGVRSDKDKENSREGEAVFPSVLRHSVRAKVKILLDKPSEMTLFDGVRSVTVLGAVAKRAENSPLNTEDVAERLSKMGNTLLLLSPSDIQLELDEGVNMAPSELNALRRAAAERFEDFSRCDTLAEYQYKISRGAKSSALAGFGKAAGEEFTTAQFYSEREYLRAKNLDAKAFSEIDIAFIPLFSSDDALHMAKAVHLPPVVTNSELADVRRALENAKKCGVLYALVDNIGQILLAREYGFIIFGGFRLNITNSSSALAYGELGVENRILSAELTLPQARDVRGGIITYGRIPLMLTERCFVGENLGCTSCGAAMLVDRKGEHFPIIREFKHRNIILNSALTYMGDKRSELSKMGLFHTHMLFTVEKAEKIISAILAHKNGAPLALGSKSRRVGRRKASH